MLILQLSQDCVFFSLLSSFRHPHVLREQHSQISLLALIDLSEVKSWRSQLPFEKGSTVCSMWTHSHKEAQRLFMRADTTLTGLDTVQWPAINLSDITVLALRERECYWFKMIACPRALSRTEQKNCFVNCMHTPELVTVRAEPDSAGELQSIRCTARENIKNIFVHENNCDALMKTNKYWAGMGNSTDALESIL